MRNDSITYKTLLLAGAIALGVACGDSATTTTDAGSTGDTGANTTSGATTTASTGEPTSGTTDSGSTTHTTHTTHMHTSTSGDSTTDDSTSTGISTGHETLSTTDNTGSTTEDVSSTTSTTTGGNPPPLEDYCACMLGECHDQYHDKWGEDHEAAEMMCMAYAESIPTVGMPAMSGNSIECYYWACTEGDCEAALGGGACM